MVAHVKHLMILLQLQRHLDKVAKEVGVNFLGGYSALVSKGMTPAEETLIRSIPKGTSRDRKGMQFS